MKRALFFVALAMVVSDAVPAAYAEGFSLSRLWPWGKQESKPAAVKKPAVKKPVEKKPTIGDATAGKFKLPGLPGFGKSSVGKPGGKAAGKGAVRASQGQSALAKATTSTKQFFAKTKDALTPWDNKKEATKTPPTGSRGVAKRPAQPAPKQEKSGNILTSWFAPKPAKDERPKTPSEWIGGKRP